MDIGSLSQIETMLRAISERQKVTTNNVANAHTPGYTSKDVSFSDVMANLNNPFETQLSKRMGTQLPDAMSTGLPVDLQKELIDMQKNMLFYNMTTRRASTIFTTLRTASQIGR